MCELGVRWLCSPCCLLCHLILPGDRSTHVLFFSCDDGQIPTYAEIFLCWWASKLVIPDGIKASIFGGSGGERKGG